MAGLIRQGHFLGAKLRSLRKRNGLTLDELSARCVQIDAAGAPSVSYLSMVETGKRMPSAALLEMLAGIFGKDSRWPAPRTSTHDAVSATRSRRSAPRSPKQNAEPATPNDSPTRSLSWARAWNRSPVKPRSARLISWRLASRWRCRASA